MAHAITAPRPVKYMETETADAIRARAAELRKFRASQHVNAECVDISWIIERRKTREVTVATPKRPHAVKLLVRKPDATERMDYFPALTAGDARWHVITFGNKYNGATLQQMGNGEAELIEGESDGDGLRYLDWLLGQDWVASYTKAAIGAYLSHPVIARRLDLALAAKDEYGEPVLQSVGTPDAYDLVPNCFIPSENFDTSTARWLGYRPGGRWVEKIAAARKNDSDPTPAHWATVGNLGDRDNGDGTVDGDSDGWVDFQLFDDDELWADFRPRGTPELRTQSEMAPGRIKQRIGRCQMAYRQFCRQAWEIAQRIATRLSQLLPVDKLEDGYSVLLEAVDSFNEARREVVAALTDADSNWYKVVDKECRDFITDAFKSTKDRLDERAGSRGWVLKRTDNGYSLLTLGNDPEPVTEEMEPVPVEVPQPHLARPDLEVSLAVLDGLRLIAQAFDRPLIDSVKVPEGLSTVIAGCLTTAEKRAVVRAAKSKKKLTAS